MAPSQVAAAVAGVQLASRQHSSLVPFFQTVPSAARQLSTVAPAAECPAATAADAMATDAISIATLFNFFMVFL